MNDDGWMSCQNTTPGRSIKPHTSTNLRNRKNSEIWWLWQPDHVLGNLLILLYMYIVQVVHLNMTFDGDLRFDSFSTFLSILPIPYHRDVTFVLNKNNKIASFAPHLLWKICTFSSLKTLKFFLIIQNLTLPRSSSTHFAYKTSLSTL